MAAPIVDHILMTAVLDRQAIAAMERMARAGTALVVVIAVVVTVIVAIMRIAVAAIAGAATVIVGECESAGKQR
jgi:hypothetical protein